MPFGIGHTPPPTHQMHVCRRVQGSQIFKRNSIISIHSKVMAFLVILLSPCGPRGPHIIHVVCTSSPHCPCCQHIVPIAPRRSPCGPHGCGLHGFHPMLSPSSPHHPTSSPHHLEGPHIIPNPPDTHSSQGGGGPESVKLQ